MNPLEIGEEVAREHSSGTAPVPRRDTHGRTLDEAMLEDQARRQAEWEARLRRAYRPFAISDVLLFWPPAVTVLVILAGVIVSRVTHSIDAFEQGLRLAAAHFVVILIYAFARFTLLKWWMRERLDDLKAGARADGVTFASDPLVDSDRQWFNPG